MLDKDKDEVKNKLVLSSERAKRNEKRKRVKRLSIEEKQVKTDIQQAKKDLQIINAEFKEILTRKKEALKELRRRQDRFKVLRVNRSSLYKSLRRHQTIIKTTWAQSHELKCQSAQESTENVQSTLIEGEENVNE